MFLSWTIILSHVLSDQWSIANKSHGIISPRILWSLLSVRQNTNKKKRLATKPEKIAKTRGIFLELILTKRDNSINRIFRPSPLSRSVSLCSNRLVINEIVRCLVGIQVQQRLVLTNVFYIKERILNKGNGWSVIKAYAIWLPSTKHREGYCQKVQEMMRSSYRNHSRQILPALLDVLDFRSNNTAYQSVIEVLAVVREYAKKPEDWRGLTPLFY